MSKIKPNIATILLILSLISCLLAQDNDDFTIQDHEDSDNYQNQNYPDSENAQRQMQFMSQKRTACLVLSRYYTNQFSQDINGIVKDLAPQDQTKFINKLYATAVEKCEPIITEMEVIQFFTEANQNFDPSHMFYIFEGYNFHEVALNLDQMTQNQQNIVKFIKQFDSEMQIRKQEQQAQKMADQRDEGIQVFFISLKNLSPQLKYLYIVIVLLISGVILFWGFSQLGQKPQKKLNKRRKRQ